MSASSQGRAAEEAAARYLGECGWNVIERNWRCRGGEIDIVARDGDELVFVEVKRHRDPGFLEWSVGPAKQRRIVAASRRYLEEHPAGASAYVRYDVILVSRGSLEHIRGAFGG